MPPTDPKTELTRRLMAAQSRLFSYVLALVHDPDQADDILQNANVVMLDKLEKLEEGVEFMAWAFRVCHFEVLTARRDHARDRLQFGDAVFERIADAAPALADRHDERVAAMHRCLDELPEPQKQMFLMRHQPGATAMSVAEHFDRPYGSVRQALYRIRIALMDCIRRRMAREDDQ